MEWAHFPEGLTLSAADLDRQLTRYGVATTVRRAIVCTCVHPDTRRPRPGHAACGGWGWQYPETLLVENLRVQWVGSSLSRKAQEAGVTEPGDYTCTWPSSQPLGAGDIFVHPVEEAVTDEVLIRGHLDPLGGSMERLRFKYPTTVEDARDEQRSYTMDVDFELAADGRTLTWLPGGIAPPAGGLYVVRYRHRAEYVIANQLPKVRHDGANNRLPFTCRVFRYDPLATQDGQNLGEGEAAE